MSSDSIPAPAGVVAKPITRRYVGIAALMLLVVAGRLIFTSVFAESLPFWDEWDAEGANLIRPWMQHGLQWSDLFTAHNEHRILWTRLISLLLFQANEQQWDNLVTVYTNVLVYAAMAALALYVLTVRTAGRGNWLLPACLTLALAWLPFGFTNSLTGFQNQFYLMIGFAVGCIGIAAHGRASWLTLLACALAALAGLFTMASGLLAPVTAGAVLMIRAIRGELPRKHAVYGVLTLAAIALTGALLLPHVAGHDPLRAGSIGAWIIALRNNLAWPFGRSLAAAGLAWLPSLWACGALLRARTARPDLLPAFGLAVWVAMQCMAMAYSRGADGAVGERYLDILALGLLANACLAAQLAGAYRGGGWGGLCVRLFPWCYAAMCIAALCMHAPASLRAAAQKQEFARIQTENVRRYVVSGNLLDLQQPFMEIPYPDPHRLAGLLSDPVIRAALPASVREPLPTRTDRQSGQAFHHGADYAWTSCAPANCAGPIGHWRSNELLPTRSALVVLSAPHVKNSGLSLSVVTAGIDAEINAAPLAGPGIFRVFPGRPAVLIADDKSPESWITFDSPVEAGRLSALSLELQGAIRRMLGLRNQSHDRRHRPSAAALDPAAAMPLKVENEAKPLHSTITTVRGGWINRVGVRIGTYEGTSDDVAHLAICTAEHHCAAGRADLTHAVDNADLMFEFDEPLLAEAGQELHISLQSVGGHRPFALWTYPANQTHAAQLSLPDSSTRRTISVSLGFAD